jgi:hypothetical protein
MENGLDDRGWIARSDYEKQNVVLHAFVTCNFWDLPESQSEHLYVYLGFVTKWPTKAHCSLLSRFNITQCVSCQQAINNLF